MLSHVYNLEPQPRGFFIALAVSYVDSPDRRRLRYQFALAFLVQMSLARRRRPSR